MFGLLLLAHGILSRCHDSSGKKWKSVVGKFMSFKEKNQPESSWKKEFVSWDYLFTYPMIIFSHFSLSFAGSRRDLFSLPYTINGQFFARAWIIRPSLLSLPFPSSLISEINDKCEHAWDFYEWKNYELLFIIGGNCRFVKVLPLNGRLIKIILCRGFFGKRKMITILLCVVPYISTFSRDSFRLLSLPPSSLSALPRRNKKLNVKLDDATIFAFPMWFQRQNANRWKRSFVSINESSFFFLPSSDTSKNRWLLSVPVYIKHQRTLHVSSCKSYICVIPSLTEPIFLVEGFYWSIGRINSKA